MMRGADLDRALSAEFVSGIEEGALEEFLKKGEVDFPQRRIQQIIGGVFDEEGDISEFDGTLTREQEDIILLFKRPSVLVENGKITPPDSAIWKSLLTEHQSNFDRVINAVGRIELDNHERLDWVGSGLVVEDGIVVTNRHVAEHFVSNATTAPVFRISAQGRKITANIDLCEEHGDVIVEDEYTLTDILHVEPKDGADLAFFRCSGNPNFLGADNIAKSVSTQGHVATIGYPFEDGRLRRRLKEAAERIFQGIYGVKRFAPGKIGRVFSHEIFHDCTTLNASSGSAVMSIETGQLVGLHSDGAIVTNVAVSANVLREQLDRLPV